MIELMRRIGFPPFKRHQRSIAARVGHRRCSLAFASEPLEARMMLAGDLVTSNTIHATAGHTTVMPAEVFSIFHALSRGGDALLAASGQSGELPRIELQDQEPVFTLPTPPVAVPAVPASAPSGASIADQIASDWNDDGDIPGTASGVLSSETDAEGEAGDVEITIGAGIFVIYNSNTGVVRLETSTPVTSLEIVSESGIFSGAPAQGLGGTFDVDNDFKIFKLTGDFRTNGSPIGFNNVSFGPVAQTGLTEAFVLNDLTISGSPEPSGVLSNKQARIEVFATDLNGARISEVEFGDEFLLRATVKDVRASSLQTNGNMGLFAAYVDVTWNPDLAEAIGTPTFGTNFTNARNGIVGDGLLDEIGAVSSSTTPTSNDTMTLFTQRMRATQGGNLQFSLDPADQVPQHETLVFGGTTGLQPHQIHFDDDAVIVISDTPAAPDLVAFAKALDAAGAVMYGAGWCPHCTAQKERFQDGQRFLPYVESTNPDRSPNAAALENNIQSYPTWIFANGTRLVGDQTLEALATAAGITIPQSNAPTIIGLDDVTVLGGAPRHVALDGYDPNGGPLTYTVTTDNPSLLTPTVLQGNRSLLVDVEGFGNMVFELFDAEAPRVTEQITQLAEDGFYDGLTFHRILNNFVIQGGDPEGDGSGGSDLPDFDDQFDVDLQHVQTGLLSMAKSGDDTNNSQFFITEGPTRWLDFNHSIFGVLVEGESNRDNISNVAASNSGVPTIPVRMESVSVFEDIENGVLRLSAAEGATGSANVTVTVTDAEGHEYSETFAVTVSADTSNGGPFLADIPDLSTPANTPLTFQLNAIDVEGDPVRYSGSTTNTNVTFNVNATTGQVTLTPNAGFVGTVEATVRVEAVTTSSTQDRFDSQRITINVTPGTPTVDLLAVSDTGSSDSDNVTNAGTLQFQVSGVTSGAEVSILADGAVIGTGTATGNTITITTANLSALGDDTYSITARQTLNGSASAASAPISLTLDQTAPVAFTSTPPTEGTSQTEITYNAAHPEEGTTGFRYSLQAAPSGATINAQSGVLTWTPTVQQVGANQFQIVATDLAGNTRSQNVNINVESVELLGVRLQVVDSSGTPISAVATGQDFVLQVYVEDLRDAVQGELRGVFSAFFDVNFNSTLAEVDGSITYGGSFPVGRLGDTNTPGLINDAGGTASSDPLGLGEFLLMSIPMVSTASGSVQFTADPADDAPLTDSLLRGLTSSLTAQQFAFGTTSLTIVDMTFAVDDTTDILEDSSAVRIRVLDNDIPVPSTTTLTVTNVATPSNGTVTIADNNRDVLYTPNANFQGTDTFTYTMRDTAGNTATATVTVNVANVNDNPIAADDTFTVAEDATNVVLDVIANDSSGPDPAETLRVQSFETPANGTVQLQDNGARLVYTPNAGFHGTDTFSYTLTDGNGGVDQASVTITVTEVNDAPVATRDIRSMQEDTTLTISISDLLNNDTPGPGEDTQTLTFVSVGQATHGTVTRNGDNIIFTPPANFFGTAAFEYTIRDNGTTNGAADPKTATGTVTINVNNVNDDPVAVDDTAVAQTGAGSITINVLANDTSAPDTGETLTVTQVGTGSDGGTITIDSQNRIVYTPAEGFSGVESFEYTISDGNGGSSTATVVVTVRSFVPGGITGFVFLDSNNDGLQSQAERSISSQIIRLTGVADNGQQVDLTTRTTSAGFYSFDEVLPGNYQIEKVTQPFTVEGRAAVSSSVPVTPMGPNAVGLTLTAEGINGEVNFTEMGIEPQFSIWEALASSSRDGFYSSVHATDGQQWTRMEEGWSGVEIQQVEMNAAKTHLTITIRENGQTLQATVARTDRTRVQILGSEGDSYLVRFRGARSTFNFA
jgi:VCBS repeat-containing protein